MTDRKRDPLPEGYEFGDAGDGAREIRHMDPKEGISIRFVRQFDEDMLKHRSSMFDKALRLAMGDEREIAFAQKVSDAMELLRSWVH